MTGQAESGRPASRRLVAARPRLRRVPGAGLLRRVAGRLRAIDSPVLTLELRARMRGARAFVAMCIYVTALSLMAVGYLLVKAATSPAPVTPVGGGMPVTGELGRELFTTLALTQFVLVVLFAPALTSGAITSEREHVTFESLALTTISSRTIVVGKLLASLCYLGLLLLCSVPILALTLILGGVSPIEIALAYLGTATAGLFFGALGLLASALVRRTYAATGLSYGLMAFGAVGVLASVTHAIPLLMFSGLTLAGLVTVAARRLLPRWRPGWVPGREIYIAVFGLSYCAIVALLHIPGLEEGISAALRGLVTTATRPPVYLGHHMSYGYAPASLQTYVLLMLILVGLALLGALGCVLGAISLFRAARAPQPDSLEVEVRVSRETSLSGVFGEAGS